MTAKEIKEAVDNNKKVYYSNLAYQVVKDKKNEYLIKCTSNGSYISLTWADNETLNGKEEEFFIKE